MYAFIGQRDKFLRPNGIVRAITEDGQLIEGIMNPDCQKDGWVAFYSYSNIYVGQYKNDLMNGNNISVKKDWTENL